MTACVGLDSDGDPIAGLFAAGVDAGGVYGRRYGGFLAWSLVSGRTAGANAAACGLSVQKRGSHSAFCSCVP